MERAAINKLSKRYIDSAKNDSKMINLFLSNSDFSTFLIRRDMWYSGKILQKGLPRTDVLLNGDRNKKAKKVKSCLSINEDNKILLYAPTFRAPWPDGLLPLLSGICRSAWMDFQKQDHWDLHEPE